MEFGAETKHILSPHPYPSFSSAYTETLRIHEQQSAKVRSHTHEAAAVVATAWPLGKGCIGGATIMQSHVMTKRRSEVGVAPLRPLALNRATSEILPSRGTLFLKGE